MGTTSAYAENTRAPACMIMVAGNYLRVRGEYTKPHDIPHTNKELPPRTRRIHNNWVHRDYTLGTTSAYAENTHENPPERRRLGNYLRVRGEYGYWHDLVYKKQELPPRTRRIPLSYCSIISASGTTSAYAENTKKRFHRIKTNRNYLRVRGEYPK